MTCPFLIRSIQRWPSAPTGTRARPAAVQKSCRRAQAHQPTMMAMRTSPASPITPTAAGPRAEARKLTSAPTLMHARDIENGAQRA